MKSYKLFCDVGYIIAPRADKRVFANELADYVESGDCWDESTSLKKLIAFAKESKHFWHIESQNGEFITGNHNLNK